MKLLITVYDKESEYQLDELDVTTFGFQNAADLVEVPIENLVYIHPLNLDQISAISRGSGIIIKPDFARRNYYLEGEAEFPDETWPPAQEEK